MKSLLIYLLQVIVCSGFLYGYYHLALRNKKFHQYNRYYLLAAAILSILIPFLNIPVYFTAKPEAPSIFLQTLTVISSPAEGSIVQINSNTTLHNTSFFNLQNLSLLFYLLIGMLVLARLILSLYRINKLINKYLVEKIDHIYFINTNEPGTPFSFFRWLFWNKKIELQSENGQQIFRHELFHIEQKHTWDIILLEILTIIFWINPFFHLIKKETKAIHEFLADQFAAKENDKWNYAELLLMQVLKSPNSRLTNPFFHNQIKRRIAMITTSQKPSYRYLRKIMVLPVAAIVVALFAFNYKAKQGFKHTNLNNPITVVIDAGNGRSADETKIMLAIAKKVKSLNENEQVKIVLEPLNENETLQQRLAFINQQHPDMLISLQTSLDGDIKDDPNGAEIYFAGRNHKFYTENRILGFVFSIKLVWSGFERRLKSDENSNAELLRKSNCPAVIIGCGHIANTQDLAFMKQPENIATIILKAIEEYASLKESDRWNKLLIEYSVTNEPEVKLFRDPVSKKVTGTFNGNPIKKFWLIKHRGFINAGYMLYCFIEENGNITPRIASQEMSDNLIRQFPELKEQVERTIDQTKETEISDKIITDTISGIIIDTTKPKQDSFLLKMTVTAPRPSSKAVPTDELLNRWQDSKTYGVWIDDKRISNFELKKHSPSDFSHYFVSKLSKNAINYGKHYYQVDLMTNKYYQDYIKNWDPGKQFTTTGMVPKHALPVYLKRFDALILVDGKEKDFAALEPLLPNNIESMTILTGQAAIAKYGDKGKNGVIEIRTKSENVQPLTTIIDTAGPGFKISRNLNGKTIATYNGKIITEIIPYQPTGQLSFIYPNGDLEMISKTESVLIRKKYNSEIQELLNPVTDTVFHKDGSVTLVYKKGRKEELSKEEADRIIRKIPGVEEKRTDIVFEKTEVPPSFPGGESAWRKFLERNLNPSIPVKNHAPGGTYTVWVQFTVGLDGSLTDLKALTKHGYGMEEEVLRIIKSSPGWIPAMQNGHKVKAYKKQPVTFVVEGGNQKLISKTIPADERATDLNEVVTEAFNSDDNKIFVKTEVSPSYPGGEPAWRKFLEKNLNPSTPVDHNAPSGNYTVTVQFIVDKEGNVSDLKALTKHGYGMEEEVLRVMKLANKWVPAIQKGHNVKAYKKQPVTFIITDEKDSSETQIPIIIISQLRKASVTSLLQLPEGTQVKDFAFSIDNDKGFIDEVYNYGNEFSGKTKSLMQNVTVGKTIVVDRIITINDGNEKKVPGVVYKVID